VAAHGFLCTNPYPCVAARNFRRAHGFWCVRCTRPVAAAFWCAHCMTSHGFWCAHFTTLELST